MSTILYFTYGSNMLEARLRQRCPSAHLISKARVNGWKLRFDKRSKDHSGKATIEASADQGAVVYGVLYGVAESELGDLDRFEGYGKGYDRCLVDVVKEPSGERAQAVTYLADTRSIDASLVPYDWYLDLIIAGAWQHELPTPYIDRLRAVPSIADPEADRPSRLEALSLLRETFKS